MEQLIKKISEETVYTREDAATTVNLLQRMGLSIDEIKECYEKYGTDGLWVYQETFEYAALDFGRVMSEFAATLKEETKLDRIVRWISNKFIK